MDRRYSKITEQQFLRIREYIANKSDQCNYIQQQHIRDNIILIQKNNSLVLVVPYVVKILCDLNDVICGTFYEIGCMDFKRILGINNIIKIKYNKKFKIEKVNLSYLHLGARLQQILPYQRPSIKLQDNCPDYSYLEGNKTQKDKVIKFIKIIKLIKELNKYLEVKVKYPNTIQKEQTLLKKYKKEFYKQFKEL